MRTPVSVADPGFETQKCPDSVCLRHFRIHITVAAVMSRFVAMVYSGLFKELFSS